jgi:hypothetical protein
MAAVLAPGAALDRHLIAALALVLALLPGAAAAQAKHPDSPVFKDAKPATCPGCGVVRSVKRVEAPQQITARERESTAGFVAQVPLGGDKPIAGSVADKRDELKPPLVTWEVVVRLDDGRLQLVRQDDASGLREGDKVRIDRGRVVRRE